MIVPASVVVDTPDVEERSQRFECFAASFTLSHSETRNHLPAHLVALSVASITLANQA